MTAGIVFLYRGGQAAWNFRHCGLSVPAFEGSFILKELGPNNECPTLQFCPRRMYRLGRGSASGGAGGTLAPPEFGRTLISTPGFLKLNLVICGMNVAKSYQVVKPIGISPPRNSNPNGASVIMYSKIEIRTKQHLVS